MSARRQSARLTGSQASSQELPSPTRKRKASVSESSPQSKGSSKPKQQKTLEQTIPDADQGVADADMKDAATEVEDKQANGAEEDKKEEQQLEQIAQEANPEEEAKAEASKDLNQDAVNDMEKNDEAPKEDEKKEAVPKEDTTEGQAETSTTTKMAHTGKISKEESSTSHEGPSGAAPATDGSGSGAIESSQSRKDALPSNVLEKGIIYFFARGRVGVDEIADVKDVARSYFVMRPLPAGAKIGEGAIDDLKNNRLLALPKKVLPRSHRDTFLSFVEKAGVSIEELREDFMKGSDYDTKTTGTRHTPAVTPIAEGVYAITTQGRDSHLAYMLTIPSTLGEVQEGMGLKEKGSFVLSTKNPTQDAPANASLPQGPDYPEEIMSEFRGLRWMGTQPKHLDYANAQVLIIGEGQGELGRAVEASSKDEKDDKKDTPAEALEKLEEEDEHRTKALRGDDTVFDDLGLAKGEYPKVKTTW